MRPSCMDQNLGNGYVTGASTYSNSKENIRKSTITLCSSLINANQRLTFASIPDGTNLAKRPSFFAPKPKIGSYFMLSAAILHEVSLTNNDA